MGIVVMQYLYTINTCVTFSIVFYRPEEIIIWVKNIKNCSPIRNSISTLSFSLLKSRSNLMMIVNSLFLRTMRLEFLYLSVMCSALFSVTRMSTLNTERLSASVAREENKLNVMKRSQKCVVLYPYIKDEEWAHKNLAVGSY